MSLKFPENISEGATGGPQFNTEIITVASGGEKRNKVWSSPIYSFECAHGVKTQEQLDELIDFFYEASGRAYPFRFKNWAEYVLTKNKSELVRSGTNNETLTIYKKYSSYTRKLTKIVDGTFKLYADDVLLLSGYNLDIETGIITLSNPSNYDQSVVFTCECEYDFWCRFDTDTMFYSIDKYNVYSWGQIPLVEVRE